MENEQKPKDLNELFAAAYDNSDQTKEKFLNEIKQMSESDLGSELYGCFVGQVYAGRVCGDHYDWKIQYIWQEYQDRFGEKDGSSKYEKVWREYAY